MQIWRSIRQEVVGRVQAERARTTLESGDRTFPIGEDDLLAVSDRLVYLGKQKDVAEVRSWLRQFDDDGRIEVAFLLLKRLADRGFVSHGEEVDALARMVDALNARRQRIGDGAWRMQRKRRDNLYIGHVDSDIKSGAATARELAKRMSPGKVGGVDGMASWLEGHLGDDPVLVVVDDFSGTGNTLAAGLEKLWSLNPELMSEVAGEGRVVCCLQTAFPEAVRLIEERFRDVTVLVVDHFGDHVRSFEPGAHIFSAEEDREFARNVMLQIGRQLVPQNPLGFGDMAALVSFHNTIPNNTLPVFWASGTANGREWKPLLPRGTFSS